MQVSILIINYNSKYFLEHCLLSVIKAGRDIESEILVWDNQSADESRQYFQNRFPGVRFFWNEENLGFGKANNRLLQYAAGEYILFLNPDTIIAENTLTASLHFFKSHTDAGAVGVRMIDGSGAFLKESKRGFPSAAASFYKLAGLAKIFPRSKKFAAYYAGHLPEKENNKTEVLAGAYMMLRKEALKKTGGFDEAFFMYGEDIDLSYRVKQAGFENYYLAEPTIIHFKGESTEKKGDAYNKHFYGAMKLFAGKHYRGLPSLLIRVSIYAAALAGRMKNRFKPTRHTAAFPSGLSFFSKDKSDEERPAEICKQNNIEPTDSARGAVCFCEGALSNEEIIQYLQRKEIAAEYFIHESGANSIIGSSDKNSNGIFISMR